MGFISLTYIAFLLVAFSVYRLIPRGARKIWLFACSVAFSGIALPFQTLAMLIYAWVVYALGKALGRKKTKKILAFGIVFSVLLLFSCKYLNFTLQVFGIDRTLAIVAPIGISYIVFQCIAYLTEIYKGDLEPADGPLNLFLYIFFFPKVMSGPIEMPGKFLEQIEEPAENTYQQYLVSFACIVKGFVKKMVVADYLAVGVDAVYGALDKADAFSLVFAVVMYSFQIYFDFSGYTDIAIGSAGLFGIRLTENFNRPYLATGIQDFWKRWHISLSEWLKKYVYIPLGGNRKGFFRKQLNTFLTFVVSGLWHGASVTYLLWGALHGLMQVVENLFRRRRTDSQKWYVRAIKIAVTFTLVTIAWIFFRIPGLGELRTFAQSLVHNTPDLSAAVRLCHISVSAGVMVMLGVLFSELTQLFCVRKTRPAAVFVLCLADAALLILSLCFFPGGKAESSFIYFNF